MNRSTDIDSNQKETNDYASNFLVAHNPKGMNTFNSGLTVQGILAIRGKNLLFEDITGRTFNVSLSEPTYTLTPSKRLRVALRNDVWEFAGFLDNTIASKELAGLIKKYGLEPNEVGGSPSIMAALNSSKGALAGEAAGGVLGTTYGSYKIDKLLTSSDKYIDAFVNVLKQQGIPVTAMAPSKYNKYLHWSSKPKNQAKLALVIFIATFITIIVVAVIIIIIRALLKK